MEVSGYHHAPTALFRRESPRELTGQETGGIEPGFLGCPACSLVIVSTKLSAKIST
jgi:hypothetical protein